MTYAALRQALENPAIYPHPTATVELRETHISLVALTDHHVYKIKKPVDLGFLDFSTLEQRRFFCEQELTLNRRLSHGVYLDVLSMHQSPTGYAFNSSGPVVDYAVHMRRLSEDGSLATLLQHGQVTVDMMTALARRLATFHAAHPLPAQTDDEGTLPAIQRDWEENFAQTTDGIGQTLSQDTYQRIQHTVYTFMSRRAVWFEHRVADHRIRNCHGDLRAEHIYLEPGQSQIIDCIEFNKRFRYIDVASEVAFLTMDLERLGAADMAHAFVQAYAEAATDTHLYRLLDFYCCYRAYVRGKVTSMRLRHAAHAERENIQRQAETYFTHALHCATRLTQPLLILTGGIIASGKSTVAEGIAKALDLDLYRSDALRKEFAGVEATSSQRAAYGQGMYSAAARQRVYDAMADLARHALRQGHSVCLDASFAKRAERKRLAALAQNVGARVYAIECLAPDAVIRERLRAREQATATISDAREDILESFRQDYEPVQDAELACHVALDTTQDIGTCVRQALAAIQRPRSG
jgi:aminoglycoside phosphotransferase family enzyme/predicted kinase